MGTGNPTEKWLALAMGQTKFPYLEEEPWFSGRM